MKNKTLLKVLSASAIFTAIAAIESYDHNAFATEVAATANKTQSNVETKIVPQDIKNLPDGTYDIKSVGKKENVEALNFSEEGRASMAASGLDKENVKLVVKDGKYSVNVTFKPIEKIGFKGYLGDLKYYDGNKTHANRSEIKDSDFKDTTIVEKYSENEKDAYIDTFKKKFPRRTVYPKTFSYNVDKNKIDANNKLETFTQVFVPVMESIFPGAGTQRMILKYDLSSLTTKTITVPKVDTKKLAKEKAEKERIEKERLAKEKAEKERIEREKLAKEKAEKERIERERLAKEKAEKERIERERLAKDKAEKERIEKEKLAKEKAEKERIEKERLAKEKAEKERIEKERLAKEKAEKKRIEKEKLAKEKAEKERIEKERLAKDKAEKERIERERLAKEKAEKERIEAERLAKEKAEKERIEAERLAKEKAEKERIEAERLAKEKAEKERIEAERLAKEKAEKERLEREKAPVTAKGEAAIAEKPEFDLDGYLKNHQGPITAKGEAAIAEKPEFDLEGYLREQKQLTEETTTTSNKKPLINDIFGQSKVKDTFVATPVGTKKSNATTTNVKKSLANTGISTASTVFLGLTSLLAAFVIRRKFNK